MFLGGWFRVRHVSIKVLWWLALASAMSVAFRLLPSSCRLVVEGLFSLFVLPVGFLVLSSFLWLHLAICLGC